MTLKLDRRRALGLIAAPIALTLPVSAIAENDRLTGDIVLGNADAPVTVIEYASLTCPHCAGFHIQTWPEFKANYVDTGKVRFIMREVYFDQYGLRASMISRCAGEQAFYPLIDQYLKLQDRWTRVPDGQRIDEIRKIGRINGLSNEAMNSCMSDNAFAEKLIADFQTNTEADGVTSTPTFVVNGDMFTGNMSYAEFSARVDKYL